MISQLDLKHAGMYQCFVRNDAGESSKATWLKVNSSPELLTPPSNVSIVEGGDARFPCETRGAPIPLVTWSKGQFISNSDFIVLYLSSLFQFQNFDIIVKLMWPQFYRCKLILNFPDLTLSLI